MFRTRTDKLKHLTAKILLPEKDALLDMASTVQIQLPEDDSLLDLASMPIIFDESWTINHNEENINENSAGKGSNEVENQQLLINEDSNALQITDNIEHLSSKTDHQKQQSDISQNSDRDEDYIPDIPGRDSDGKKTDIPQNSDSDDENYLPDSDSDDKENNEYGDMNVGRKRKKYAEESNWKKK